ncbi:MAG: SIMPL domain-containing protein [Pseudomonadota bacterium]
MAAENEGLHLSGTGEVSVVPDLARVTLEVTRSGADAVTLKAAVDEATGAVLKLTRRFDIEARDVVAATVNIAPDYRGRGGGGGNELIGVTVSRSIHITVRALERLPQLINDSLKLGINGVSGIALDTSRRTELEEQALALAIDDARAEARRVAAGFGVAVGTVLAVHVDSHTLRPQMARMALDTAEAAFAPGEMIVRRSIRAQFAIAEE